MAAVPGADIFPVSCTLPWLEGIPSRIRDVYLGPLFHHGTFNEVHVTYTRPLLGILGKRKVLERKHVGIWGWNSWCGLHVFPYITGPAIDAIYARTIEAGFARTEPGTGLLPHAVLHENGAFGSKIEFKCYGGQHGEAYNLDNMLCWAKMALERVLVTGDVRWLDGGRLGTITTTVDFVLDSCRGKFNPALVHAGIEGDWTECTDWDLDNANVNVNLLETLDLLVQATTLAGTDVPRDYTAERAAILEAFTADVGDGGFWHPDAGHLVHGNDGKGEIVHGNAYFESTANYLALLHDVLLPSQARRVWEYLDAHRTPVELPYPVLTNHRPRTGARRKAYGNTVTNGDVWMVLGSHAAAARLRAGFVDEGTAMYKAIVDYESREGVLHNCIYPRGHRVNDSWDPEIGNYGALYAAFVLGVLGITPLARGLQFRVAGLAGMDHLATAIFFNGRRLDVSITWNDGKLDRCTFTTPGGASIEARSRAFVLSRDDPPRVLRVD